LGCTNAPRNCAPDNYTEDSCFIYQCNEGACHESTSETCSNSDLLVAAVATAASVTVVTLIVVGAVVFVGGSVGAVYAGATYLPSGLGGPLKSLKESSIHEQRLPRENPQAAR
jgi:hypothetical protein